MKKLRFAGIIALIIVFTALSLTGCPTESDDPTYTVWTDVTTYTEFYNVFQTTLSDGYYVRIELPDAQWNQLSPSLTNEGKHNWTEDQLYNYFIGRGFGSTEANQQKSWLITIKHGFIASRTGSIVDLLLK
jgi:hypothetical protein